MPPRSLRWAGHPVRRSRSSSSNTSEPSHRDPIAQSQPTRLSETPRFACCAATVLPSLCLVDSGDEDVEVLKKNVALDRQNPVLLLLFDATAQEQNSGGDRRWPRDRPGDQRTVRRGRRGGVHYRLR